MENCLWCGKSGKYPFCDDGGKDRNNQLTGSYCYSSFQSCLKLSNKLKLELNQQDRDYLLYQPEIDEWFAKITKELREIEKSVAGNHFG